MNKRELLNQILFRREAEELAEMTSQAFQHHLTKGHIIPAKEYGSGKGKNQLFWREDVLNLKIGKYKEEKKMRVWQRDGYVVNEVEFDGDLHEFMVVREGGEVIATITPASIEDMQQIIEDLDAGEDVNGWEDGMGNVISI